MCKCDKQFRLDIKTSHNLEECLYCEVCQVNFDSQKEYELHKKEEKMLIKLRSETNSKIMTLQNLITST